MKAEGQQKIENRKGRQKAESQRGIGKEEITSTEFPEGGNTIYTKRTPRHPNGGADVYNKTNNNRGKADLAQ